MRTSFFGAWCLIFCSFVLEVKAAPILQWTFNPEGQTVARTLALSPNRTIHFGTTEKDGDGRLHKVIYAIDDKGKKKWAFRVPGGTLRGADTELITGADSAVYFGVDRGEQEKKTSRYASYAISSDGKELWKIENVSGLKLSGGTLYYAVSDPPIKDGEDGMRWVTLTVHAVGLDGKEKWVAQLPYHNSISPFRRVNDPDGRVFVSWDRRPDVSSWSAMDPNTGKRLTSKSLTGGKGMVIKSDVVAYPNKQFVYSTDTWNGFDIAPDFVAINPNCRDRWVLKMDRGDEFEEEFIGPDGTMYLPYTHVERTERPKAAHCTHAGIYAVSPMGKKKWGFRITDCTLIRVLTTDSNGTVYASTDNRMLYAIDRNGNRKWTLDLNSIGSIDTPIVTSDGMIYVLTERAGLFAFHDL